PGRLPRTTRNGRSSPACAASPPGPAPRRRRAFPCRAAARIVGPMASAASDGAVRLVPDLLLVDGRFAPGRAVGGRAGPLAAVAPAPPGRARGPALALPGKALLPGTVNAHCHTFQSLLRGLGDDLDFMGWRDHVLYPYSTRLDRDGIYLGAAFAFAEM